MKSLSKESIKTFQAEVKRQGQAYYRDLPWRPPSLKLRTDNSLDPYAILVSEMMLQQTQVPRVIPKYEQFLQKFPTLESLSAVPIGEVLRAWSGLGYNRRAKFLHQAAWLVTSDFGGQLPRDQKSLQQLPGVGANTAGALMAYAFNQPTVFVETNIRSVFIHHFFQNKTRVTDTAIAELLEQALVGQQPRQFYWSLMDYGTYLKSAHGNLSRASVSYSKQSKFSGSRRQLRGQILRLLSGRNLSQRQLTQKISDQRLGSVLDDLLHEGLIFKVDAIYKL